MNGKRYNGLMSYLGKRSEHLQHHQKEGFTMKKALRLSVCVLAVILFTASLGITEESDINSGDDRNNTNSRGLRRLTSNLSWCTWQDWQETQKMMPGTYSPIIFFSPGRSGYHTIRYVCELDTPYGGKLWMAWRKDNTDDWHPIENGDWETSWQPVYWNQYFYELYTPSETMQWGFIFEAFEYTNFYWRFCVD